MQHAMSPVNPLKKLSFRGFLKKLSFRGFLSDSSVTPVNMLPAVIFQTFFAQLTFIQISSAFRLLASM